MHRTTIAALIALLFAASPALAQQDQMAPQGQMPEGGQGMEMDPELMAAQERLQELQQQLSQIQQEVFEGSDELQTKQEKLENRATAKMEDLGYDPESHYSRMEEIYDRFESGDMDDQEQQQLAEEFQQAQMELQQAQQEAMQDEEFRQEMEADMRDFQDDLLDAMQAEHPETEDLLAELEELQAEVQGQMGGGGAGQAPEGQMIE